MTIDGADSTQNGSGEQSKTFERRGQVGTETDRRSTFADGANAAFSMRIFIAS